jgi:hypothetical protein
LNLDVGLLTEDERGAGHPTHEGELKRHSPPPCRVTRGQRAWGAGHPTHEGELKLARMMAPPFFMGGAGHPTHEGELKPAANHVVKEEVLGAGHPTHEGELKRRRRVRWRLRRGAGHPTHEGELKLEEQPPRAAGVRCRAPHSRR